MSECIFCKIVAGEIPSTNVYEDHHCIAFLDIQPLTKGHTVVIPKHHGSTVFDLGDADLEPLMSAVKKTMAVLQDKLQPEGFNVGWNHGEAGGQAVEHLHIHILPRWKGDGGGSMHSIVNASNNADVEDVAKLL